MVALRLDAPEPNPRKIPAHYWSERPATAQQGQTFEAEMLADAQTKSFASLRGGSRNHSVSGLGCALIVAHIMLKHDV